MHLCARNIQLLMLLNHRLHLDEGYGKDSLHHVELANILRKSLNKVREVELSLANAGTLATQQLVQIFLHMQQNARACLHACTLYMLEPLLPCIQTVQDPDKRAEGAKQDNNLGSYASRSTFLAGTIPQMGVTAQRARNLRTESQNGFQQATPQ